MTTQSPDQSLSQSQVSVLLGQIAEKYFSHGQNAQSRCKLAILEYISLTQSPAPSKEMEELPPSRTTGEAIERLLTLAGISVEVGWTFMDDNVPRKLDEVRERMMELYNAPRAAELGKDREADKRLLEIVLSDLQKTTADADNLLKERDQLKRELDEAHTFHEREKEGWINAAKAQAVAAHSSAVKILALSASHQRQKEALKLIDQEIAILFWTSGDGETLRDGQPEDCDAPIRFIEAWKTLRKALAETPDVSMLERVVGFLAQLEKNDSYDYGELSALLSTLQPDHQK